MILPIAMLLDACLGEPNWLWSRLPHPAVLMGRAIKWGDDRFNRGMMRRLRGVLLVCALASVAITLGWVLTALGPIAETLMAAILIAQRSLCDHVQAVATGLRQSLSQGRHAVSMIVSRDTSQMDQSQICRAAIESAAENLSDGVIAPVFWFAIAGLPGLMFYKMINTADSMIGYRTPKHQAFGWAAARLDDVLNLAPARLTALMIALLGGQIRDWTAIVKDARQHRSPNAGWPEAAMARTLGIALSGPRSYHGETTQFPWVNDAGRIPLMAPDIDAAIRILWQVWGLSLLIVVAIAFT